MMEVFFVKHLQNRATCASSGASSLWDYTTAFTVLTGVVQTSITKSQLRRNPFANTNQKNGPQLQLPHISGSNGPYVRNQRGKTRGGRGKRGGNHGSGQGGNHLSNPAQVCPPFAPSFPVS